MLASRRPDPVDVVLALLATGLAVADHTGPLAGYAVAGVTAAPLVLRLHAPVGTALVVAGATAAYGLLGYGDLPCGGIGLLVGVFTVASLRPPRTAATLFPVAVAGLVAGSPHAVVWPDLVDGVLALFGAWVLGAGTRYRGPERVSRARAARDLRDVLAHHLSVISVQAGLAQYTVDRDPATARSAVEAVGDCGRQALAELRGLLDVLCDTAGAEPDRAPQPGLGELADLVDRTRAAGLSVAVAVTGQVRPLPPGLDLCAYRMVQETLAGALETARTGAARVGLHYGRRTLTVVVTDTGTARRAYPAPSTRERARLYGGVLTAGPAEEGGCTVVLRLPMGGR
ncbi:histidine kinase [Actinokineospora auranticolor]|uniref:sensor histidine kinase n=1 Tax=Actinokineospora auranticolor TaxID=155976 RepID=UPI0015E3ADAF|nr:histidine kinase [Actinokineospora auranticolor]